MFAKTRPERIVARSACVNTNMRLIPVERAYTWKKTL